MSDISFDYTDTMRERIERTIETLITLLDEMAGDSDIEPNGDENDCNITGSSTDRETDTCDDESYLSTGTVGWDNQPQFLVDAEGDESEVDYPGLIAGGQGA